MTKEFYLSELKRLEDKHESELTQLDLDLIMEYSIELEILVEESKKN